MARIRSRPATTHNATIRKANRSCVRQLCGLGLRGCRSIFSRLGPCVSTRSNVRTLIVRDIKGSNGGELRIIMCIEFDRRATPAEVASLNSALCDSPNCIHSIEVTGGFDLIVEFAAPAIGWYKDWLSTLAEPFARVV